MRKKLTITVDEKIYDGLYRVAGRRNISSFVENLVRPHVVEQDLQRAYEEMSKDRKREAKALEWSEATIGDINDESR